MFTYFYIQNNKFLKTINVRARKLFLKVNCNYKSFHLVIQFTLSPPLSFFKNLNLDLIQVKFGLKLGKKSQPDFIQLFQNITISEQF